MGAAWHWWKVEADDEKKMENRVKQIEANIEDKKLIERLSEHIDPLDLIEEVLDNLHKDRELAALVITKLKKGCIDFLNAQTATKTGEKRRDKDGNIIQVPEEDAFQHISAEV